MLGTTGWGQPKERGGNIPCHPGRPSGERTLQLDFPRPFTLWERADPDCGSPQISCSPGLRKKHSSNQQSKRRGHPCARPPLPCLPDNPRQSPLWTTQPNTGRFPRDRFSTSDVSQTRGGLWGYNTRVLGGVFKAAVPPSLPALLPPPSARIQRPDSRSRCGPSYAAARAAVVAARGARPPLLRATLGLRHSGTCRW